MPQKNSGRDASRMVSPAMLPGSVEVHPSGIKHSELENHRFFHGIFHSCAAAHPYHCQTTVPLAQGEPEDMRGQPGFTKGAGSECVNYAFLFQTI